MATERGGGNSRMDSQSNHEIPREQVPSGTHLPISGRRVAVERVNVLRVLEESPGSPLRDVHQELVDMGHSRFEYSPSHGEGWNDERWAVRDHLHALEDGGFAHHGENPYPWYLTDQGKHVLDVLVRGSS